MSNSGRGHGQWNILASVLIDSGKYFDVNACNFTDELAVIKLCEQNPLLGVYISKWLSKLNQEKERTVELTNKYRIEGNKHFDEFMDQNDLATDYYTKAIFSAPKDSLELALAHGNRAACLMSNYRFYEEGYFDCKLALQFNFPQESLQKLFERRLHLASQTSKREEYLAETHAEMKKMGIRPKNGTILFAEKYQSKAKTSRHKENSCTNDSNAHFKNKNLTEKSNSSMGRYLITEEAIEENELVYCEKAFSFVPTSDKTDSIAYACQFCAQLNILPFPCYSCARASYCSPVCQAKHESIHKWECAGHRKNLWSKVGVGYLAFRTCIVGFNELVEMLEKRKASTLEEVWSALKLDCYKDQFSYGHVLRLLSNITRINPRNILRYALTAHLLTIYLSEYTDFFRNLPPICGEILANVEDWKSLMTALMLKHMEQAYFNGQSPTQLQLLPPTMYRKSYGYGSYDIHLDDLHLVLYTGSVFSAFHPRLAMMNHSCDPNIRTSFSGLNMYAYASRKIGQHEEILSCYGPHYKLLPTVDRLMQLDAEFFFECKCNRCVTSDETCQKYYEYYCPNDKCNVLVELDDVDIRWWYFMNTEYCDEIDRKFACHKCGTKLPIDPTMMRKFEKAAQGHIDKGYTFHSTDSYVVASNLLNMYFRTSKCLGKYHELRIRLSHMVLGYCVLDVEEKLFPRLAFITMENFVNRIERYGTYTLEFLLVSAYALSILKIAKRIERTNTIPEMARDIAKIRKILDVKAIEKSLIILPHSMQEIFRNIIRDVERDDDDDDEEEEDYGLNELSLEHMRLVHRINNYSVTGSNSEKSVG